jgi:NitT/TauT family transport system substrate-binding protein
MVAELADLSRARAGARSPGAGPLRVGAAYFHLWPNDAGLLLASDAGLFARAGLDVELGVPDPLRGDALSHLVGGSIDFALCPPNRLLVRAERGEDVIGVAAINHRGLETIQTVAGLGIERPRDLEGRRIALNPTPRGLAMISTVVAADGGDPEAVQIVDSGVRELGVDDIAAGETDATFGGYWAWDALLGELPEEERVLWRADELHGVPRYHSYVLATRRSLAERCPEAVRSFLAACGQGYLAAGRDPDRALALFERVTPFFPRTVLRRSLRLVSTTWSHDGRWGQQRSELFASYADWLAEHGILEAPDDWTSAITNEFLEAGSR